MAPVPFIAANLVIAMIVLATIRLLLQGRLLPPATPTC